MYKVCKFRENRLRNTPLQGIYIPKFGKISVKFSVLGILYDYTLITASMEGEIWHGVNLWYTPPCQISPPSVQSVTPVGHKNSKLPTVT